MAACVRLSRKQLVANIFCRCALNFTFFLDKYSFIGTHTERWHVKQQPNMEKMEFRGLGSRLKSEIPSVLKPLSMMEVASRKEREQNECDHKQVFKVTFSWEIN